MTDTSGRVLFGPGAVAALPNVLAENHRKPRVLVVLSASSANRSWRNHLLDRLEPFAWASWQHPSGSPTASTVDAIIGQINAHAADVVIGVGGGGVVDAAKAAVALVGGSSPDLVAIPTTPGSGAEVTPFATVWDFAAGQKHSVPASSPALAIVDPELCLGLPRPVLVASVLDTLTQGIEAAWSVRATPESMRAGLTAAALVGRAGDQLFDPTDPEALTIACLAGLWSGRAIAVSQTTVCHAISYSLTARYGVRHGHACVLSLPTALRFNAGTSGHDCLDSRGVGHISRVIDRIVAALREKTLDGACERIDRLRIAGGLGRYDECGADGSLVVQDALSYGRLSNNPRLLDEDRLHILVRLLEQQFEESVPC